MINQVKALIFVQDAESVTWNPPETTVLSVPYHNKVLGQAGPARQMIV